RRPLRSRWRAVTGLSWRLISMPARPSPSSPEPMSAAASAFMLARSPNIWRGRSLGGPPSWAGTRRAPGGRRAGAWLYRLAPKDGTAIASVSPNAILARLMDESQNQYDPTRFNYLAGAERGTRLCVTFRHSRVWTIEDALTQRAIIGATSAGSPTRD